MRNAKDSDVRGGIVGRVWPCVPLFVKPSRLQWFFRQSCKGNCISILLKPCLIEQHKLLCIRECSKIICISTRAPLDQNWHDEKQAMSKAKNIDGCGGIVGRVSPCVAHFVKPSRLHGLFRNYCKGKRRSILRQPRLIEKRQLWCVRERSEDSLHLGAKCCHPWWMCLWFWFCCTKPDIGCADAQNMNHILNRHGKWELDFRKYM